MQKSCLLQQQQQHSTSTTTSTTITTMTIIHQLFGGELKNTLQCTKCGFCSNKKEIFLDLSLEIFPKKIQTLSKALEHFTCIEKLDETNQWKCSNCHQFTCAEKSLKIHTIPNILTIQLKRFDHHSGYGDYGGYGGYGGKINKHIEFPLVLDLKKYLSSKDNDSNDSNDSKSKSTKYHLYGVLVHAGYSTNCGHYYAFVKNMAGQWYEMNDEKVRWVNVDTVLQQKAYMLFYTRIIPTSSTSTKPTSTTAAPTVVVSSSSSSSSSSSTSGSVQKLTTTALPSSPSPQDPPIEMDMKSFLTSLKRQVPEEEEEKKEQGKKQKTMNNISSEEVTKAIEATDAITTTTTTFTITKDNVPTISFAPVFTGLLGKKLHCYSSKWKPFHIQMSIQQQQQQQQQQVSISSSSSLSLPSSSSSSPPPLSLSLSQEASSCKKKKSTLSTLEFHPCLLKDFGGNAAVFGKSISKWEEDQQDQTTTLEQNLVAKQEEIISKLKKEDWHHRRKNRQDEWNESLDMGKIKKIKNKKEFIPNEGKQNAFQLVFEKKKTTTRS
jgi:ubiquitin carboxyl-terminal hydrolase 36/42